MKITLLTGKTYNLENEFDFPLEIRKSPKATRLSLKIDAKKRIPVLTMPIFCTEKRALKFVREHEVWVQNALLRTPEIKRFENKEKISLFGQEVQIIHTPEIRLTKLEKDHLLVGGDIEFLHRRVKDYIKKNAKTEFFNRSKILAQKIGCPLKSVTIKDTKSRWGSCSTLHNINYNWRIALAPEFVINYLMAHEVSHLKHPDHSAEFWSCVKNLCPDMDHGNTWLKKFGKNLNIYE